MITAIIVDDLPSAREMLEADLKEHFPNIKLIGTAESVISAAKLLKKEQPDLLFLDIDLGDGTGFDLLEIVPDLKAKVIFATASEAYAIRAFKFAAVDYLLKPIDVDELKKAVEKARGQLGLDQERLNLLSETIRNPDKLPNRISLHTLEKIRVVEISDILRCESDGNNTIFYLNEGDKIFVTKTLKYFEKLLEGRSFMRVHQSHLVNVDYIKAYIKKEGGYLLMKNDENIPVAVRKKAEVVSKLGSLD